MAKRGPKPKLSDLSSATAIAYVRVSTEDQKLGPVAQHDQITAWSAHNCIPVLQTFEDLGVSGSIDPVERPAFALALAAIEDRGVDFLVVARRDRLSRDMLNTLLLERQLARLSPPCRVVTASEDPGTAQTPESVLAQQITDSVSEFERAKIRKNTRDAVRVAREQGRFPGPRAWSTFLRGQRTIQLMKKLAEDGYSNTEIVTWCALSGVLSPHRGVITMAHVRSCLASDYPESDLDETAVALAALVKVESFYESKFRTGDRTPRP